MKETTIQNILEIGMHLIIKKGFHHVGLQEILHTANIPKGSFYYYFKSKEDFGLKVIEYYSGNSLKVLKEYLTNRQLSPKERILSFYKGMRAIYQDKQYTEGCLMGNCSLELSDLKDTYAQTLTVEFEKWEALLEGCIAEGQKEGTIQVAQSAKDLAAFVLNSWEGALLRMKSVKASHPLDTYITFIEKLLS